MESPNPCNVRTFFDEEKSTVYDCDIRISLPGYEALHGMVNALLSATLGDEARILVAGAGTGMELLLMGALHPQWRFTAFDPSPEMLAVCKRRVTEKGMEKRVTCIEGTIDDVPGDARFDGATSILVSHFILSRDERLQFFSSIARCLKKGAPFLTADLFGEKDSPEFEGLQHAWGCFNIINGRDPEEMRKGKERSDQVVSYLPENHYKTLLKDAGFTGVTRYYQALTFGGWVCRRKTD